MEGNLVCKVCKSIILLENIVLFKNKMIIPKLYKKKNV